MSHTMLRNVVFSPHRPCSGVPRLLSSKLATLGRVGAEHGSEQTKTRLSQQRRPFSSSDRGGRGRGGQPTGRGGGRGFTGRGSDRGGRGGGGRGGGGRGAGAFARFRERRKAEAMHGTMHGGRKGTKKPNFAREVLEPAARGELQKGHTSGIPRLAGRKSKGHQIHDVLSTTEAKHLKEVMQQDNDSPDDADEVQIGYDASTSSTRHPSPPKRGVRVRYASQSDQPPSQLDGYDSESDYDELEVPSLAEFERHPQVIKNKDGTYVIEYDDDWGDYDSDEELDATGGQQEEEPFRGRQRNRQNDDDSSPFDVDPEEAFFYRDITDFSVPFPDVPEEEVNKLMPLANHGENLDDFLQAMVEHPTKFAEVKRYNLHPESLREAQPHVPKNRQNPEPDFVKSHKRFLHVTGLPHVIVDEEPGEFDNPLHRHEVTKMIVSLLNVKPEHVSPANMTSAFVGYTSIEARNKILRMGVDKKFLGDPLVLSKLDDASQIGQGHEEFVEKDPGCVALLTNMKPGTTREFLASSLFPAGTEIGSIYGPLSMDHVAVTSPTSALIRFESAEQASSALESSMVKDRLRELGQCRIRLFKAKRELKPSGYSGPNNAHEMFKRGEQLVVHGDSPSKQFYISHFEALALDGLEETTTKQDIANWVQPYCAESRDVEGSVEFVTCSEGLRTNSAYVGFDAMGEAALVLEAFGGEAQIGNATVQIREVHDKHQRRGEMRESRPLRSEEELLDSLNNWEQFVDEEDLKYLEENGVKKHVLDDAFRAMRFGNKTFGPTDLAMQREKLSPELESGSIYKETVQEYVRILKECVATPEDPGLLYEGMFLPNEQVDLSVFDNEKERQKQLQEKRNKVM